MTSSGRYTYAREIVSKKATKVLSIIKRSFSNMNALVKPVLLYACEIWGPELLSYKTHFDKSTIEQVHRVIQPEIEFICSLSTTILPWLKSSLLWGTVPSGPWFLISPVINQPSTLLDCSGECYREFRASFVQKPQTFLRAPLLCNT